MPLQLTPYLVPVLAGGLGMAAVAGYAWRRRTRAARLFALLAAASALWALAYVLEIAAGTLAAKLWWAKVQYVGIVVAPVLWLAFALLYTGREKWLTWQWAAGMGLIPLLTVLLVFTNDWHGAIWPAVELDAAGPFLALRVTHGPWFWVHLIFVYTLNVAGSALILLAMARSPQLYRRQSAVLLLAIGLPWLGNALYLSGLGRVPQWDVTPAMLALSAAVIAWGAFRYQLLDLLPVAPDTLIDAASDGFVVLDTRNRIVDLNPAAQHLLGRPADAVLGQPITDVFSFRPDLLGHDSALEPARTEIETGRGQTRRSYDLSVTPLVDSRGLFTGRLIALRDITERKQAEAELRAQKQLFENLVSVARATAEGPSLAVTLQNALNVAAKLAGAERGSLFLLNPAGRVTHSLLTYGGITPTERQNIVRRVMDGGLAGWVVRNRQAALIADTADDDRWLASSNGAFSVRSALGLPIVSGSVLVGVLTLSHSRPNCFTSEHLELIQAAADQMALALRNAQIFESQRQMAQRQVALYGVLRAVGEQLNPASVARAAVEAIAQLVAEQASWPGVGIALPDRERQCWRYYAADGALAPAEPPQWPLEHGVIGRAFVTGQPQYVPDVEADPDYIVGHPASRSELALPLRRGTRVLGVLNLESDRADAFPPEDVQLAESLADAVALALDNAHLYQAIADESSRLQALIKSSRDGIFMISMDRRFLVVNAPVLQLLGLPGAPEDWLGQPVECVLAPLRPQAPKAARAIVAELRRVRRGDEPPAEGEAEVPPHMVHWLSLPVLAGTVPLGRLVVLRDVTQERLVQKMREDLTDTMVHDLRNPLTNIRMALQLLGQANGAVTRQQREDMVQIARSSTERMLVLVNAILDVSRLENGQMPLVREPVDIGALLAEVLPQQLPLVREKGLHLENLVPADLPRPQADVDLVRRVLQNLIGNALKFTPDDGCVRITARVDRAALLVTVHDSGPGLAPEMRHNVFQKFVTGRHRERGSGLGLAFCRLAVEAHGGRIWVESEPGQGAAFHFTLPLALE